MSRNWGIPNTTTRPAVGGNQPSGPHRAGTQRDSNSVGLPNSGSKAGQLFIDEADREFAAYLLFVSLVGLPLIFVGATYLLFVA